MSKLNIILIILSLVCMLLPVPSFSATDVQIEQGFGFLDVATPTLTLATTTPTIVGTLPAGTKNIYITAFNGDVLVGSAEDLTSGALWVAAAKIASGTTQKIDGIITLKPKIYLLGASAPTEVKVAIAAWGTN